MNHKVKKSYGAVRVLSVLLALLLCVTLGVEAGAETLTETTKTTASTEAEPAEKMDEMLAVKEELDTLRSEMEQGKLVPYIALGVGAVGLLIAVIAAVLALTKRSEEPELDVTTLASRKDVEKLDEQNRTLAARIGDQDEMLHRQIDQQNRQSEALRKEILRLRQQETQAIPQKKEPEVDQIGTDKKSAKVCGMNLVYNSYSPGSSFLSKSGDDGEYTRYDDHTVAFVNLQPNSINQLSGWSSDGLFYLFDPEIDGKRVGGEQFSQYPGFYRAVSTVCRAKVRSLPTGDYVLLEKGTVAMKGIS